MADEKQVPQAMAASPEFDLNNLIDRAKGLLLDTRETWQQIANSRETPWLITRNYLWLLAAIPALGKFIGFSLVGYSVPFQNSILRTSLWGGLKEMAAAFVLNIAAIHLVALGLKTLSATFRHDDQPHAAFKLVAYSVTPAWLAGAFFIVPGLGQLALFGALYAVYVFYHGVPVMLDVPDEDALAPTAIAVAAALAVWILVEIILNTWFRELLF